MYIHTYLKTILLCEQHDAQRHIQYRRHNGCIYGVDLKHTQRESRSDARQIQHHATFLCTHTNGSALGCTQKVLQTKPPQSMRPQRNVKVLKVSVKKDDRTWAKGENKSTLGNKPSSDKKLLGKEELGGGRGGVSLPILPFLLLLLLR